MSSRSAQAVIRSQMPYSSAIRWYCQKPSTLPIRPNAASARRVGPSVVHVVLDELGGEQLSYGSSWGPKVCPASVASRWVARCPTGRPLSFDRRSTTRRTVRVLDRAGIAVAEPVRGVLQRACPRRAAEPGGVLVPGRSAGARRGVEDRLQRRALALQPGVPRAERVRCRLDTRCGRMIVEGCARTGRRAPALRAVTPRPVRGASYRPARLPISSHPRWTDNRGPVNHNRAGQHLQ